MNHVNCMLDLLLNLQSHTDTDDEKMVISGSATLLYMSARICSSTFVELRIKIHNDMVCSAKIFTRCFGPS